jgi:VanZ family protein
MKSFLKYWLPVLFWLGLIFIGSTDALSAEHTSRFLVPFLRWLDPHISSTTLNSLQVLIRKLGHLTEYAILATLVWRALRLGFVWKSPIASPFWFALIGCAIFAASDEFHQSFVPTRTSSLNDVMIDLSGALIGLAICVALVSRKVVKKKGA